MSALLATVVTAWHLYLLRPAWEAARRQVPPRPVEFAVVSLILYYDVGLWLDVIGADYEAPGFSSFGVADLASRATTYVALIAVPPILLLAARMARRRGPTWAMGPRRFLTATQERVFFAAFSVVAVATIAVSLAALRDGGNIPGARLTISEWLGPGAVLLYVPISLAAYYPLTENGRSRRGLCVSLILALAASLGTLGLGQRTLLLLPFLVVLISRTRFRPGVFLAAAGVALVVVAGLGVLFKPTGVMGSDNPSVMATMNESLARAPVMAAAVEHAKPVGTSVMEYPGEGYVYSALFFVPRPIAPFKGESTAQRFTDTIEGEDRFGRWGYGVGMIEEAILNVGLVLAPGVLAGIGWALGLLEGLVSRRSALIIPSCGGAVWLAGYHLPAILVLFGVMFVVVLALDIVMSRTAATDPPSTDPSETTSRPREETDS